MPLATKNGSLILKDGKLAEGCGCCGGLSCCTFFDWSLGGPLCVPIASSSACLAQNNQKVFPCTALQTQVSVSGFGEMVGVSGQCSLNLNLAMPSDKSLAVANGTLSGPEVCGGSLASVYKRDSFFFPYQDAGTTLYVIWGFSKNSENGQQCQQGLVRFRVTVDVSRSYPDGFRQRTVEMRGSYESECVSIESLASSGLLSAGRSVQVTVSGGVWFNGYLFQCALEPQIVTVSFAANPLP